MRFRTLAIRVSNDSFSSLVQNGKAYDKAILPLNGHTRIVIPNDAAVERSDKEGFVEVFMEKSLSFSGHPPRHMSIYEGRDYMGCAWQIMNNMLILATYGEWDSHIEGGAKITMLLRVPSGIEIKRRMQLSGEESVGHEEGGKYVTKPVDLENGWWYGPISAAPGWHPIACVPDPEATAGKVRWPEKADPMR